MPQREFQTEVNQLLQLIVHSLYSHPEIFLRELISNSSDALDKLRHLTLIDDAYKSLPFDPRIDLELDEENKTLTIADTGIGMNEEIYFEPGYHCPLRDQKFSLPALRATQRRIRISLASSAWASIASSWWRTALKWFPVRPGKSRLGAGSATAKTGFRHRTRGAPRRRHHRLLHFNEEGKQYANSWRLQEIVKKYSNHIAFPIFLTYDKSEWNEARRNR